MSAAEWAKSFGDAYNVIAVAAGLLIAFDITGLFALPVDSVSFLCVRSASTVWVLSIAFLFVPVTAIPTLQFFLTRAFSYHQRSLDPAASSSPSAPAPTPTDGDGAPVVVVRLNLAQFIDEPGPSWVRHLSLLFFFLGCLSSLIALLLTVQAKFTGCEFSVESGILVVAMLIVCLTVCVVYNSATRHLKYNLCKSTC